MIRQIGKRLATTIPSIIGVIIVTFLLTRVLPGDPAAYFAGPAATPQAIEDVRRSLGLDKSLPEQFVRYVTELSRGDFGKSLTSGQPVRSDIAQRLPASAELTLVGLIISMLIAVPLGIAAAVKQGSFIDHACRMIATAGVSLPVFFTGLILVYVFYYLLGWSPAPLGRLDVFYSAPPHVTGFYLIDSLLAGEFETFRASLSQLILPAATLAIFALAPITRMTRASMLAVLGSDFVRTARSKGMSESKVVRWHLTRNALVIILTTIGLQFGTVIGQAVVIEKLFSWPGLGSLLVDSVTLRDIPVVQGSILVIVLLFLLINMLVDVLCAIIDPRIKYT